MTSAFDIIRIAENELGVCEAPLGSNSTKYGAWYGMNNEPWCNIFVSWVFSQADALDLIGGKHSYTPSQAAWFKERDQYMCNDVEPKPGWLAFFWDVNKKRIAHIGIVTIYSAGKIYTIEGNKDNRVKTCVYDLGNEQGNQFIIGYGVPAYERDSMTAQDVWDYEIGEDATAGKNNWAAWKRLSALQSTYCNPHDNVANGQKGVITHNQIDYIDARVDNMYNLIINMSADIKAIRKQLQ